MFSSNCTCVTLARFVGRRVSFSVKSRKVIRFKRHNPRPGKQNLYTKSASLLIPARARAASLVVVPTAVINGITPFRGQTPAEKDEEPEDGENGVEEEDEGKKIIIV